MVELRRNSHTVSQMSCHIVWATKYRYHILKGDIQTRCRDILILKGVVSKDHIHIHIEYPPRLSVSMFVKKLKGRSLRLFQQEFPEMGETFLGSRLWCLEYRQYN